MSWRGLAGVATSFVVHGAIVVGLFVATPPERPVKARPPVRIKLASPPRPAEKKPEPPPEPPQEVKTPEAEKPAKPETPPEKVAEAPKPEPKPEPKKVEKPKKPKTAKKKDRKKRKKTKKAAQKKTRKVEKNEPPKTVAEPPPRPKTKKFSYAMPDGPGGSMALPSGPGGGGSRFGDVDGDADGKLGGQWKPGERGGGDERGSGRDDDGDAEETYDVVEVTKPPKLLSRPSSGALRAAYPDAARREGREADVKLRLLVNAKGRVARVKVVRSAGPEFDAAARKLAKKLKFRPAKRGGESVKVWIDFPFKFRLDES